MQSQLQTLINNSLSSTMAFPGILPRKQPQLSHSSGKSKEQDKLHGGGKDYEREEEEEEEGFLRREVNRMNRKTRLNKDHQTMVDDSEGNCIITLLTRFTRVNIWRKHARVSFLKTSKNITNPCFSFQCYYLLIMYMTILCRTDSRAFVTCKIFYNLQK